MATVQLLTHCVDWSALQTNHYIMSQATSFHLCLCKHVIPCPLTIAHWFTLNVNEDEDEDEVELSDWCRWNLWHTLTKSAQPVGWASPGGTCDQRCCWPCGRTWGCWRPGRAPWLAVTAPRWRWWHGRRVNASAMNGTSEGCKWHCIFQWQWPPGWR